MTFLEQNRNQLRMITTNNLGGVRERERNVRKSYKLNLIVLTTRKLASCQAGKNHLIFFSIKKSREKKK